MKMHYDELSFEELIELLEERDAYIDMLQEQLATLSDKVAANDKQESKLTK